MSWPHEYRLKEHPHASENAWSTLAKTIRDVDKAKIQDQKEDIDTLLVFAGLFSAVMTAFIVQSYPSLQEDPADMTVVLLQQILEKMDRGPSNSEQTTGSPSFDSPPFKAPTAILLVNILWFASLLFSLVSASIGMLVKQWLREYLAVDSTFPQVQLRVRHFRAQGLTAWKVFELAAILPLLLQLSLGLFFIGLCIFAWSVHPALGQTAIPIVALWACFIGFTTLAPAFSARCPYKSPFMNSPTKAIRRCKRQALRRMRAQCGRLADLMTALVSSVRRNVTGLAEPSTSLEEPAAWILPSVQTAQDSREEEEEDVIHEDSHMRDVLVAADATLSDDNLLCTVILEGALESPHAIDWIRFLRMVLSTRLQREVIFSASSLPPDLSQVPLATYEALVKVTIRIIYCALDKLPQEYAGSDPWLRQCLEQCFILLLHSSVTRMYPIPERAIRFIGALLSTHPELTCRFLSCAFFHLDGPASETLFRMVSNRLPLIFAHLDTKSALFHLKQIMAWRILHNNDGDLPHLLHSASVDWLPLHALESLAEADWESYRHLTYLASSILKKEVEDVNAGGRRWSETSTETVKWYIQMLHALHINPHYYPPQPTSEVVFIQLFTSTESTAAFLKCLCSEDHEAAVFHSLLCHINCDLATKQPQVVTPAALHNFSVFLSQNEYSSHSPASMRLCYLATYLSLFDSSVHENLDSYRTLFTGVEGALHATASADPSKEQASLARRCLWRIHTAESGSSGVNYRYARRSSETLPASTGPDEAAYCVWRDKFKVEETVYPDSLVRLLHAISGDVNRDNFRVRRLLELSV